MLWKRANLLGRVRQTFLIFAESATESLKALRWLGDRSAAWFDSALGKDQDSGFL